MNPAIFYIRALIFSRIICLTLMACEHHMWMYLLICLRMLMCALGSSMDVGAVFSPQWRSLSKKEQAKYFSEAEQHRLPKMKHPEWSCKVSQYANTPSHSVSLVLLSLPHRHHLTCQVFVFRVKINHKEGRGSVLPHLTLAGKRQRGICGRG